MKAAGSSAAPAEGLSPWSYSLLPDGKEVEDTIPEWMGTSEETYRGVWVSRSQPYKQKLAAQLGLFVSLFPAALLLISTLPALGARDAFGVCAITYLVFAIPIWASLRTMWGRNRRGTCNLYAPGGLSRDAFKALLGKGFENAGMPLGPVGRQETSFEEWQIAQGLSFTFWNATGTTPDRGQIAWTLRADAAQFRILKGMVLAALRSAEPPALTDTETGGQKPVGQARAV